MDFEEKVYSCQSVGFFYVLIKYVKLNGLPFFFIVAIVVDRLKWMSHDPFKVGFKKKKSYVFTARKEVKYFHFINRFFVIDC